MPPRNADLHTKSPTSSPRNGFVFITVALAVVVLFGMLGLCFDLGRIYIARNELQTYVDSAALVAAMELDGTDQGILDAVNEGKNGLNHWNFGTSLIDPGRVTVSYSTEAYGTYIEAGAVPSPPTGYGFAQVEAETNLPMFFIPVFQGLGGSSTGASFTSPRVPALAAAGRLGLNMIDLGLIPYAPRAHLDPDTALPLNCGPPADGVDPFGFQPSIPESNQQGSIVTMRYPPPGQQSPTNRCPDDISYEFAENPDSQYRGFINIGAGNANFIQNAIIGGIQNAGLTQCMDVEWVPGQMATVENRALETRISGDSDRRQGIYYQQYWEARNGLPPAGSPAGYDDQGNGQRMVIMPVPFWNPPVEDDLNSGIEHGKILGFGKFFLLNYPCFDSANIMQETSNPSVPCCAEYVGPAGVINGTGDDVGNPGVFKIQLVK